MNYQLTSPNKLKELAKKFGFKPSKRFGQNFLLADSFVEKMLVGAKVSADDTVVEIGPGFGILTLALARKAEKVIGFEIEKKLEDYWNEVCKEQGNIEIMWGNALKTMPEYLKSLDEYIVVANLPYQITSRVLRLLLEEVKNKPKKIVVMVQKEVADRICSKPGDMSLLSASVQYYGQPRILCRVPKSVFWPVPAVDSAVILIEDIVEKEDRENFFKVVRAGFSAKRKQAWKNISHGCGFSKDMVQYTIKSVVGNEKVRAEDLSVEEWEKIVKELYSIDGKTSTG